jgi:hypothetical protein
VSEHYVCPICHGAVPGGKEAPSHTALCAQVVCEEIARLRASLDAAEKRAASAEADISHAAHRLKGVIPQVHGDADRVDFACEQLACIGKLIPPGDLDIADAVAKVKAVADAALDLRDSGYDGPFMGEAVEPLLKAIREWEDDND